MPDSDVDPDLVREAFGRAVRDVLRDETWGLSGNEIRRRIHDHPEHDLEVRMQDLHKWLGELQWDGQIVLEPGRRYRLPVPACPECGADLNSGEDDGDGDGEGA